MLEIIYNHFFLILSRFFPRLKIIIIYTRNFKHLPNLIKPETFNEKIIHKVIFDRNPRLALFADKYLVRDYVKFILGGEECLIKLYGVIDTADKIKILQLPNRFIMKPNHLCGQVKIVFDFKNSKKEELKKQAEIWLRSSHYYRYSEWAYKNIKPLILFEQLLEENGRIPDDWKFFCFNGEPRFIQVDRDRLTNHKRNFYDLELNFLPVKYVHQNFNKNISRPNNFDSMLEIARKLSAGIDFLRVDLYNIDGKIYFGELTNYHGAGLDRFEPDCWDMQFGTYWKF